MSKDTIYRQVAIDVVSEHCGICIQRIVDLPSAQPQWIPCSEMMPNDVQIGEECPVVIFCTKEKTYTGFYEYYLDGSGKWWAVDCDDVVDGVIAWMPLPDPYEEDMDE